MKVSKKEASYRHGGTPGHRCHDCAHLELRGAFPALCRKVAGTVRRNDVCDLFEKKARR